MKITYKSNITQIVKRIETLQKNVEQAKVQGLSDITKAAFEQVGEKYIVQGSYIDNKENYIAPPNANIKQRKIIAFNPKTGWKKIKETAMFVLGKVVSRTRKYSQQIEDLSRKDFDIGTTRVGEIRVDLKKDSVKIYAESNSETYWLEKRKQAGKTPIRPIFKAFRSAVNIWKKVRIKMGKK